MKCFHVYLMVLMSVCVMMGTVHAEESLLVSTYIGGSAADGSWPSSVFAFDEFGNIFAVGMTASSDFPVTAGAFDESFNGGDGDVYIAKLSPDGQTLLAATFVGGSGHDSGRAAWFGSDDYLYIAGNTESTDFPVSTICYDGDYNGGSTSPYGSGDGFVIRINTELTEVSAATYLGGSGHDIINKIIRDAAGRIIIAGQTNSVDFPTTLGAYSTTIIPGGDFGEDAFVAILNSDLSALTAATYLGGSGDDFCEGLVIGQDGSIYISGWERSTDFPTTEGAYDRSYNGFSYDSFVSKFSGDLSTLMASTYLGGSSWEFIYAMAGDADDNIFVAGHTASTDFPVSASAYDNSYNGEQGPNQGDDVFISRLDSELSRLDASTYLGGGKWENAYGLVVNATFGVMVSGSTSSLDFPVGVNPMQGQFAGGSKYSGDGFVSSLNLNLSELTGSTYFGGSGDDGGQWIMFKDAQTIGFSGFTASTDFPVTSNAFQMTFQGGASDVFIALIDRALTGDPTPTPTSPDTPTPEPTQPCTMGVTLWMPSNHFSPNDICSCSVTVCNDTGASLEGYPLFVILDVFSAYFFAPSFDPDYDNYLDLYPSFAPEKTVIDVLPEFNWPAGAGDVDGVVWYAGVTDPSISGLIGDYDMWIFGWSETPTPIPMTFIEIPAGIFEMGAPLDELCREPDEIFYTVTLTHGISIQQTEVTQYQWESVFGSNPSKFEGMNRPVEKTTWFDACIYCNRLSVTEGLIPCYYTDASFSTMFDGTPPVIAGTVFWNPVATGYRLPTEAEWEYACRAGAGSAYNSDETNTSCTIDPILDPLDWYASNSDIGNGRETHNVRTKTPNHWNLYNMHGNVGEWCWDWYAAYPLGSAIDPIGPDAGTERINRGGAFNYTAGYCRSGNRWYDTPDSSLRYYGFRVVRTLNP